MVNYLYLMETHYNSRDIECSINKCLNLRSNGPLGLRKLNMVKM